MILVAYSEPNFHRFDFSIQFLYNYAIILLAVTYFCCLFIVNFMKQFFLDLLPIMRIGFQIGI